MLSFFRLMLVVLCTAGSTLAIAQSDAFYYAMGERIALEPNRSAIALHFQDGQMPGNFQSLQARTDVASIDVHPYHNRVVVQLQSALSGEAQSWAEQLGFPAGSLRSAAFGFIAAGSTPCWLTHDVVIQTRPGVAASQLNGILARYNATFSRTRFETLVADVQRPEDALALGNALEESGLVRFAHPDFYAPFERHDDPLFGQQFQLNNTGQTIDGVSGTFDIDCNAPEAWTVTLGSSSVIVAVIDDGVEAHEDLEDGSGASRVLSGFTPATGGNGSPGSGAAHGQSCTGIIAASHNNLGVQGIAPNVKILPVNIFAGGETTQDLADAFTYAKNNGADVISNSWGYPGACSLNYSNLTSAINDAANNGRSGLGCVISFSSGNDYNTCISYPSTISTVLAVGAVTNQGNVSNYSNQGSLLDIVAPSNAAPGQSGAGVRTTDRMGSNGYSSGNYTTGFGGTSAACPVVAGVAALVVSADPGASASSIRNTLTSTATDMGTAGFDNTFGFGRVNAAAALSVAGAPTVSVSGTIVNTVGSTPVAAAEVRYDGPGGPFTATTDASGNYAISDLIDGQLYLIYAGKWGFLPQVDAVIAVDGGSKVTALNSGYGDDFNNDLGWSVSGSASTGQWVRGEPIGTDYSGAVANPDNDAGDVGDEAYMTGNGGGAGGTDDVDGGNTVLTSPSFDLSGYAEPWVRYSQWFFNDGGSGTPDDILSISLSNGSTTATLQSTGGAGIEGGGWTRSLYRVSDFITPTANMTLIVETADGSTGHIVEAAFDRFFVIDSVSSGTSVCTNPPTGLNSTVGATGVTLDWNSLAAEGAVSYVVSGRRAGTTGAFRSLPAISEPASGTFVNQSKLRAGWTYEWKVQATCTGGVTSPESASSTFLWPGLRTAAPQTARLQPNPAVTQSILHIDASGEELRIQLQDLAGRTLQSNTLSPAKGPLAFPLDLSNLAEGLYYVSIQQGASREALPLVVAR